MTSHNEGSQEVKVEEGVAEKVSGVEDIEGNKEEEGEGVEDEGRWWRRGERGGACGGG